MDAKEPGNFPVWIMDFFFLLIVMYKGKYVVFNGPGLEKGIFNYVYWLFF